jgi:hypothetical protein
VPHGLFFWSGTTKMKYKTECLAMVYDIHEAIHRNPKKYYKNANLQLLTED